MKGRPPEQSTSPPAAGEQHVKKRRPRRREDPCERVDCQQHACMVCGRGWCSESASCRGSRWRSGGCRSTRFQVADSVSYVRIGEDDTLFPWARSGRGTHRPAAGCAGIGRSSGLPITVCSLPVAGRRPRSKLKFTEKKEVVCRLPFAAYQSQEGDRAVNCISTDTYVYSVLCTLTLPWHLAARAQCKVQAVAPRIPLIHTSLSQVSELLQRAVFTSKVCLLVRSGSRWSNDLHLHLHFIHIYECKCVEGGGTLQKTVKCGRVLPHSSLC